MADTPPQARKPAQAPSRADLADRDRYARLSAESIETVRNSAQAWRTGLVAFITLVTTGVVIKGRDTTVGLSSSWRLLITLLIGGGLLLAIVGLWQALAAEAGTGARMQTLHEIRAIHGNLTAYEVEIAAKAAGRLQWGRRAVACAVLFILLGVTATWWAPAPKSAAPSYIDVTFKGGVTCGILRHIGRGQLQLTVNDNRTPVTIPLDEIAGLTTTDACP